MAEHSVKKDENSKQSRDGSAFDSAVTEEFSADPVELSLLGATLPPKLKNYEFIKEIGRGGMGIVWRARQLTPERIVALKFVAPVHQWCGEHQGRFKSEVTAIARLNHPNIVKIFEVIDDPSGVLCFSMQFVDGSKLSNHLRNQPLGPRQTVAMMKTIADAVASAHDSGVYHRDLKPSNVLIDRHGEPMICDFGLAVDATNPDERRSDTGLPLGTLSYMPPEQAAGKKDRQTQALAALDVFGMGTILYEILTGRPPYRGESPAAVLRQAIDCSPPEPRMIDRNVDRDIEAICLKCLEKSPLDRYMSAGAVREELQRYLDNVPLSVRPAGGVSRCRKWVRRHPVAASALSLITIATVVIMATQFRFNTMLIRFNTMLTSKNRELSLLMADLEREQENTTHQLAESKWQMARFRGQEGRWKEALGLIDEALAIGHPDKIKLRLGRVRAFDALNRRDDVDRELESLLSLPDLGAYRGQTLLWRGDTLLGSDTAAALECTQLAIDSGLLSEAEKHYALALQSDSTLVALDHLQKADALAHFDLRILRQITVTHMFLGQWGDARRRAEILRELFPKNPIGYGIEALDHAMNGRIEPINSLLDAIKSETNEDRRVEISEDQVEWLRKLFGFVADLVSKDKSSATTPMTITLAMGNLIALGRPPDNLEDSDLAVFFGPPCLGQSYSALLPPGFNIEHFSLDLFSLTRLMTQIMNVSSMEKRLEQATSKHPEGLLLYAHAKLLENQGRIDDAAQGYARAYQSGFLIPHYRDRAAFSAARAFGMLFQRSKDQEMIRTAMPFVRACLDAEVLTRWEITDCVSLCEMSGDIDLGIQIVNKQLLAEPKSPYWLVQRAPLEIYAGNYVAAIKTCQEILEQTDDDQKPVRQAKRAKEFMGIARQKLHKYMNKPED